MTNVLLAKNEIEKLVSDVAETIVGDTPVSVQLNTALSQMATADHVHEEYVTREEFNKLKEIVEQLVTLVGDTSVSEQIAAALKG